MGHNLIPPFVMREAGVKAHEVPRIHCGDEVDKNSHSIIVAGEPDLRIPLRLRGIFSYFPTRALHEKEIESCDDYETICLTPEGKEWDPNDHMWAQEEDKYVDHRGDLVWPRPQK